MVGHVFNFKYRNQSFWLIFFVKRSETIIIEIIKQELSYELYCKNILYKEQTKTILSTKNKFFEIDTKSKDKVIYEI